MTIKEENFSFLSFLAIILFWAAGLQAMPTVYPTGTTIWYPDQAFNGYVLITPFSLNINSQNAYLRAGDPAERLKGQVPDPNSPAAKALAAVQTKQKNQALLIDMMGNVVHAWDLLVYGKAILLPNGHIFVNDTEYDWGGKVVVKLAPPTPAHHDGRVLANGNYLILGREMVAEDKRANVKDEENQWWGTIKRKGVKLVGDTLFEMTPSGKVVWEWDSSSGLDLNRFSPVNPANDWTHGNTISPLPENKWYDAGDKRFKPGNILYNPRNLDEVVLIDRDSKKIVWSWIHKLNGGLSHAHSVDMIPKGMPGEGNILVFDNGLFPKHRDHNGQSMVLEINPIDKDIVWKYETVGYSNMKFFSKTQGQMQRMPNGNTFIVESNTGRLFQVKPLKDHPDGGEIVWEFIHKDALYFDQMVPYDYCPQLKNLPKPKLTPVIPPQNEDFHIQPKP